MRKYKVGNSIPLITMLIIEVLAGVFNLKGLFIIGLVALVPLSFFIEGLLCSIKKGGFILPLLIPISVFVVYVLVMLNDSAYIYIKYYSVVYILGYIFGAIGMKIVKYIK